MRPSGIWERPGVTFHINTSWNVSEEGGGVAVLGPEGELLQFGGELREVSVVVGVGGVEAGVDVVRHVPGAVIQICCKREIE